LRRRIPLLKSVLVTSALLALAGIAVLFLPVQRVVVASGSLAGGTQSLRSPLDGRVERVLVRSGERVHAGDPLLLLESAAVSSDRARCAARLLALGERHKALQAELRHLDSVRHEQEREEAALELRRAAVELEAAERRLLAQERLREQQLVAEIAYEDARAELELARLAHHRASLALAALPGEQGARAEALRASIAESERRQDELHLEAAELARLERLATVLAPEEGVVLALAPEELLGRRVLSGEELLRLGRGEPDRFQGLVGDLGRARLREGLAVRLRVEGHPWLLHGSLRGRTTHLGDRRAGEGFPVEVALEGDRRGLPLFEGMRASARILLEESVPLWRLGFERIASTGR
jgi:multidrug resistance efflux pump